ncbi:hypothetical protein [Hymenobacter terricola]|uniref:hypothetical protein n=1 Tax=Hymenobacter terricola TaxID=2819236 RepID=UPI001CF333CB|nr:hypothetical protein [Hymenobacter terricola]
MAHVREWFGLDQAALALYLGVSQPLVHGIETRRRGLTPAVSVALLPLLLQLPSPEVVAAAVAAALAEDASPAPASSLPPVLPPGTPPPAPADLDFRRRVCQQQAGRAVAQAAALARQARVAARWAAVLPALLPADPDDPAAAPLDPGASPAARALAAALALAADPDAPARAPDHAHWLRGWLARRAQPLPPAAVTRYHLLRARAAGLLAEAAALGMGEHE